MAQIVDADHILARTGQQDISEVSDVISEACVAATVHLSSFLRTGFDQADHVDFFQVPEVMPNGYLTLATSNGFIDPATVVVQKGRTVAEALVADQLPSSDYFVKKEEGLLLIHRNYIAGDIFRVSYTSGFPSDGTRYDQTLVPDWLKEAATQYVIYLMNSVPSLLENPTVPELPLVFTAILDSKARVFPSAVKPLY